MDVFVSGTINKNVSEKFLEVFSPFSTPGSSCAAAAHWRSGKLFQVGREAGQNVTYRNRMLFPTRVECIE